MDIGLLPDIILLEIFRHLPYIDLCKASQASPRWRRISQDKSLHKVIDIRDNNSSWNLIDKFIQFQCTKDLLDLSIAINDEPRSTLPRRETFNSARCLSLLNLISPNLKYLSLDQSVVLLSLYSCIKYLPNSVTHFSLRFNCFYDMIDDLTDDMKKPRVERLAFSCSTFPSMICLDFLDCFPNLKELHMDQVDFCDNRALRGPLLTEVGKSLRVLNLEDNDRYPNLYAVFENCVALEELYLAGNESVDDETILDGADMPHLNRLCVIGTSVQKDMASYVKKFPKLKYFTRGN